MIIICCDGDMIHMYGKAANKCLRDKKCYNCKENISVGILERI